MRLLLAVGSICLWEGSLARELIELEASTPEAGRVRPRVSSTGRRALAYASSKTQSAHDENIETYGLHHVAHVDGAQIESAQPEQIS